MAPYSIRMFGDPVLKQRAAEVTEIDGRLARLAEDMLTTMYDAPGLGLAAPQVGVQKRFFVYDIGDGPRTLINPIVKESRGEWVYDEGCLSVPGLSFDIVRPKEIHLVGVDLDGNDVSFEADELLARLFQHELDHLDGILLLEHLDESQRKAALKELRRRTVQEHRRVAGAPAGPVAPRAASCPLSSPRLPAVSPSSARPPSLPARCVRSSTPGSRSRWSSPAPTSAARAVGAPSPAR